MKKRLSPFLCFLFFSTMCFAQTDSVVVEEPAQAPVAKYFVVTANKDTTKCFELTKTAFGDLKCKCEDGKKKSFDDKQVYCYKIRERVGGENSSKWGVRLYFNMPMSAEKDAPKKFMSRVMDNKGFDLFMFSPRESSGPYGTSTSVPKYYLFDKGSYIDELTEENEKRYLPQLYEGCDRAVAKVAEAVDFITKLDEATRIYREHCENQ